MAVYLVAGKRQRPGLERVPGVPALSVLSFAVGYLTNVSSCCCASWVGLTEAPGVFRKSRDQSVCGAQTEKRNAHTLLSFYQKDWLWCLSSEVRDKYN